MAVLVTRPAPVNAASAARLRAAGFEVLSAPLLRCEAVACPDDADRGAGAVLVTSAAALRAVADHPMTARLAALPLFAVGAATAEAARAAGFTHVAAAAGDAASLCDLVAEQVRKRRLKASTTLLYLAGTDLSCDLAAALGARGLRVVTRTVYRMAAQQVFPDAVQTAFANDAIEAVLHYSRRSAATFVEAARSGGVEIAALALPHCCISENVAVVLREAGAQQIAVARAPDEAAMIEALGRALRREPA